VNSPPLKLMPVQLGECFCAGYIGGDTEHLVWSQFITKGIMQPALHQVDRQVGDVDADPATLETFGYRDGGAATAEGVKDKVFFVTTCTDNALQQRLGFLSRVAQTFLRKV